MNNAVNRRLASLQRALATAPTDGLLEDSADPNYAGQIVSGTPTSPPGSPAPCRARLPRAAPSPEPC